MGRWDTMEDRAGFLAWFNARKDFQVYRDLEVEPEAWDLDGETLCPECLMAELPYGEALVSPADPKSPATQCDRCRRPLNARGDELLRRARAFVEAAEAAGYGEGDTGSDDGPYDATGYAAVWLQREEDEAGLSALAEEHGFRLDGTNEWGFKDGNGVLYYYFPKER